MKEYLEVIWDGDIVGFITRAKKGTRGRVRFQYSQEWIEKGRRPVSLSLPCSREAFDAEKSTRFFGNLLPEGTVYYALCEQHRIVPGDVFAFLRIFGLECAGALAVVDPDTPRAASTGAYKDITDTLPTLLSQGRTAQKGIIYEAGARLSIAGAQDKLPVYSEKGRYYIPEPGSLAPTTDILKPVPAQFSGLGENESFCLALARRIGLPAAEASIVTFDGQKALLVERFDRERRQEAIHRLHQEDFCQALGYSVRMKYEADGGPGFSACADLLLNPVMGREEALLARALFIRCAVFNFIIGNCDAHGKNFSLLYPPDAKARLAPFYDLVSTRCYPELDQKYAMAIGKTYRFDRVSGHSWREFAQSVHIAPEKLQEIIAATADKITASAEPVVSEQEATYGTSPVYEKILSVIGEGHERIEKTAESLSKNARQSSKANGDDDDRL